MVTIQELSCIPVICEIIYKNLDDKSLGNCRLVSKCLKNSIENGPLLWRRILKRYVGNLNTESWKKVLDKIPVRIIKDLAIATSSYDTLRHRLDPHNWLELVRNC